MTAKTFRAALVALALVALPAAVSAQTSPAVPASAKPSQARVDAAVAATFGKNAPEWIARIEPDETLRACNRHRNLVPTAELEAIMARELARIVYPADGKLIGDWKSGARIARNGRGGQFSDPPGTVAGGNCYACHQLDPKEVSYGTLGPSLAAYGRERKYEPDEVKAAYAKIYNPHSMVPCSNMPRFGTNNFLTQKQIIDLVAYLFDPESPVNK